MSTMIGLTGGIGSGKSTIAKVFATIEEWRGNAMTWGKLDREGKL